MKKKEKKLTDDEIEALISLIRLDLADDTELPDCNECTGDAGCC